MPLPTLDPGTVFVGRYRIVRLMKAGGMGEVHEAVHVVTGRRCALKVMLRTDLRREELRQRFLREARVVSQVRSDYIVDVFDAGIDDDTGMPFLVMELLEGEDLGEHVGLDGPLDPARAVTYLSHVALALAETHRRGVVHRDIKPSNLFLTRRNDGMPLVKVLDFGVAKLLPPDVSAAQATSDVGTPLYMAPEQFRSGARVSSASDIYSLGMLAYTLLVGAHYWQEERDKASSRFAFAGLAVEGPREAPTARAARRGVTLPLGFDAWFARCTAYALGDRYAGATESITELALALDVPVPLMRLDDSGPVEPIAGHTHEPDGHPETVGDSLLGTDGSGADLDESSARAALRGADTRLELEPPSAPRAAPPSTPRATAPSAPRAAPPPSPAQVGLARLPASTAVPPKARRRTLLAASGGVMVSTAAALVVAGLARGPSREAPAIPKVESSARSPATAAVAGAVPAPSAPPASALDPGDLPMVVDTAPRAHRSGAAAERLDEDPTAAPADAAVHDANGEPRRPGAPLTGDQRRRLYSRQ